MSVGHKEGSADRRAPETGLGGGGRGHLRQKELRESELGGRRVWGVCNLRVMQLDCSVEEYGACGEMK